MKKLVFLGACLLALASAPAKAQTGGVVVVRVTGESGYGKLVIVRPGDKIEEMKLAGGFSSTNMKESGITMQHVFAGLYQEGYSLKSSFSDGSVLGVTLVFVKEK